MRDDPASVSFSLRDVSAGRDIQVIAGVPAEQLDALVRDRTRPLQEVADTQRELLAALRQKLNLNEAQVRAALAAAGEAEVPPERIGQALVEIAGRYKELLAQLRAAPGDDPEVARLKAGAEAALGRGDLDGADALLAEVQRVQDEAASRRMLAAAAARARRAQVALTRLRYLEAAALFAEAARHVPPGCEEERLTYLDQEARAFYRQGKERGDDDALAAAVARYRTLLRLRPRERVPLDWAKTQSNLGGALRALGERRTGADRLEEAVEALRAALQEHSRERDPLGWAATQTNLGNALARLGEREAGTKRLEEAVWTLQIALEERTREKVPLDWAESQMSLGAALAILGGREEGTERLRQAAEAYRAALEEWTRERVPLCWAIAQNNLGSALQALGEREGGTARLEEAVQAYEAALPILGSVSASHYVEIARENREQAAELLRRRQPDSPIKAG